MSMAQSDPTTGDDPIHRRYIETLSDDELVELIKAKRERVNVYHAVRRKASADVHRIKGKVTRRQYERYIDLLDKKLAAVDKAFPLIEKYIVEIRAARMELFGVDDLVIEKEDKNGTG